MLTFRSTENEISLRTWTPGKYLLIFVNSTALPTLFSYCYKLHMSVGYFRCPAGRPGPDTFVLCRNPLFIHCVVYAHDVVLIRRDGSCVLSASRSFYYSATYFVSVQPMISAASLSTFSESIRACGVAVTCGTSWPASARRVTSVATCAI